MIIGCAVLIAVIGLGKGCHKRLAKQVKKK